MEKLGCTKGVKCGGKSPTFSSVDGTQNSGSIAPYLNKGAWGQSPVFEGPVRAQFRTNPTLDSTPAGTMPP